MSSRRSEWDRDGTEIVLVRRSVVDQIRDCDKEKSIIKVYRMNRLSVKKRILVDRRNESKKYEQPAPKQQ